jgi:hypothetical protein
MKSVHSFQGTFSFLISFDEKSNVKTIAFSENVPSEFILVVQNNFNQTIEDISRIDRLKGTLHNKKILLMLQLSWMFNYNPNIMTYFDDGTKSIKFKEESTGKEKYYSLNQILCLDNFSLFLKPPDGAISIHQEVSNTLSFLFTKPIYPSK